ncbi:hypothetical protein [Deinococcus sp. NW-56]|uniref:hypothetical protein n=1 Tax=Deinococcus sp. NW-56 TaxID=2080419 RepID=UPI00131A2542|nr:hypothetical protein [Deinococcus sp. NW-56]
MKKTLLVLSAATLLLLPTAEAKAITLRSIITGSGGQTQIFPSLFTVTKRTADYTYLTLGIGQVAVDDSKRLRAVMVLALKEYLKPSERALFNKTVHQVATKCFNLAPERLPAISAWLDRQNASPLRDASVNFGPMSMNYSREIGDDGTYVTNVTMQRTGKPGVAPWVNYCVR